MSINLKYEKNIAKYEKIITNYKNDLENVSVGCLNLSSEEDIKNLFKGVIIMFIENVICLYGKLLIKLPDLRFSKSSDKITNLNMLLKSLQTDGILFGLNCNDIILKAYITYFYVKYRDQMMNWDISQLKLIDEINIREVAIETAEKEQILETTATEYLNIIPEIILMINNLDVKDILHMLYYLNYLNIIIDTYFYKMTQ